MAEGGVGSLEEITGDVIVCEIERFLGEWVCGPFIVLLPCFLMALLIGIMCWVDFLTGVL